MNHFPLKRFKDILTRGTNNWAYFNVGKALFSSTGAPAREEREGEKKKKKAWVGVSLETLQKRSQDKPLQPSSVLGGGVEPTH